MTTTHHTETTVDDLVLRRVELDAIIARATEEKQAINQQLISELGDGTHETQHARVLISRRGTVDAKRLTADYPAVQYPTLYKHVIDNDRVKAEFAPAALEQYKTYSAPSVTIK